MEFAALANAILVGTGPEHTDFIEQHGDALYAIGVPLVKEKVGVVFHCCNFYCCCANFFLTLFSTMLSG